MKFIEYGYDASKLIKRNPNFNAKEQSSFKTIASDSNVIYFFYNSNDECLYIGEAGTCLYDRCYKHENPHTGKPWFIDTNKVKIIILDDCIDKIARKALEHTFILAYRPLNNHE